MVLYVLHVLDTSSLELWQNNLPFLTIFEWYTRYHWSAVIWSVPLTEKETRLRLSLCLNVLYFEYVVFVCLPSGRKLIYFENIYSIMLYMVWWGCWVGRLLFSVFSELCVGVMLVWSDVTVDVDADMLMCSCDVAALCKVWCHMWCNVIGCVGHVLWFDSFIRCDMCCKKELGQQFLEHFTNDTLQIISLFLCSCQTFPNAGNMIIRHECLEYCRWL